MRNTRKIFVALLVVLTLLMSMAVVASAAKTTAPTTFYLTPNSNWKVDNARFAAYTWDGGEQWFDMTDADGDGVYECTVPAGVENIIFCRMNPSASANNWNNKWNQTADLKYDGTNNHYTVKEGTWDKGGGTWSLIQIGGCVHAPSGEGTVITAPTCTENGEIAHTCSKCGEEYKLPIPATGHSYDSNGMCSCGASRYTVAGSNSNNEASIFGTGWDVNNSDNDLAYNEATGEYVKVYKNVPAGSYKFKVVEDHSWNVSHGDANSGDPDGNAIFTVVEAGSSVTISFKGGKITVTVEAPAPDHQHVFVDGKCECGETDPNYVPETPDHQHVFVDGKCECGETDPNYVPPVTDVTYTIAGTGAHLGTEWDPANADNDLVKGEDGLYTKVYENVKAGSYELKVAENHSWDVSYGADGGSANLAFSIENDGSTLTVSFDPATKLITVHIDYTAPEHQHVFVDGKCECGETDPTYTPPHEHVFVDGKCECGETDPNYTPENPDPENPENPDPENPENPDPEQPAPELTLVQKIMKAVTDFFANIANWFKNLFAGFKK